MSIYQPYNWQAGEPIIVNKLKNFDNNLVRADQDLQESERIYNIMKEPVDKRKSGEAFFIQNKQLVTKNIYYLINDFNISEATLLYVDINNQLLAQSRKIPDNVILISS